MSKKVSIIIPCKNELNFIESCLKSIINNDFPKSQLEVLVIDGMSTDGTRAIIEKYALEYPFIKFIENRCKYAPNALNIGIKNSIGKFIIRMDAHSTYSDNYVSRSIRFLEATNIDVVGGVIETCTRKDGLIPHTIRLITSHKFGVGNSSFRVSKKSGFVDTVPFGAYRRALFDKVGLFNERLIRNQDNEFSNRVLKNGGKIYMSNKLKAKYFNQESIIGLLKQAFRAGYWNVYTFRVDRTTFRFRYFAPMIFVLALMLIGALSWHLESLRPFLFFLPYLILNLFSTLQLVFKGGNILFLLTLPAGFFLYHFTYGLGSLVGIYTFYILGCRIKSSH